MKKIDVTETFNVNGKEIRVHIVINENGRGSIGVYNDVTGDFQITPLHDDFKINLVETFRLISGAK